MAVAEPPPGGADAARLADLGELLLARARDVSRAIEGRVRQALWPTVPLRGFDADERPDAADGPRAVREGGPAGALRERAGQIIHTSKELVARTAVLIDDGRRLVLLARERAAQLVS